MPSLSVNTNVDLGSNDAKNALMTKLTQVYSIISHDFNFPFLSERIGRASEFERSPDEMLEFGNCGRLWRNASGNQTLM